MSKKTKKDQLWFNNKYSHEEVVDITGSKRLDFAGFLRIGGFANLKSINLKKLKLVGLEIINCSQLNNIELSELGKLERISVNDCREPIKLNCSCSKLTGLEVSNLIELNCSNTSIERLSLNLCPDIRKLNCSNNKKLVSLDVSNCSKLEFLDCIGSKLTSLDISNCPKSIKIVYPPNLNIIQERKTKNLIVVGRTGGGKSTLSNVLTDTEEFKESSRSISVTKDFQKKDFKWHGKNFLVVDTMGVSDTKLPTKKVLYKILDGIFSTPEGISQVLFVIDGRFTADEAKIFNLLTDSIFSIGILEYITIVRTKFSNFRNKAECDEDRDRLQNGNEAVAKIVKSCNGIVYVDNPPINFQIYDDDDENTVNNNKKARQRSREILLDYLDKTCQEKYFKLKTWGEIRKQITDYLGNNYENLPEEIEINNEEFQTLIKITKTFCSIT